MAREPQPYMQNRELSWLTFSNFFVLCVFNSQS